MYTVLDESLMVKGRLSLNNGQGSTSFFGDTITTQLATDNANDPTNLTTNDYTNQDKQGNAKQWSHSLTISFESTDLGTSITTNDYLMYFDDVVNHYYLMKVLGSDTDRSSGYITATAINAAIYELGKQLIQTEQTLSQVDLKTFVTKMYKNAPFSLQIADNNLTTVDYTISANTSLQALLQDLQTKFNVDVDSWVEVDNTGHITDRVLYFGNRGRDNGELIRYGGAKGFEAMTATEVSDIIYTKLYVTGKTDDKNTTKGHIGTVNNGLEYIVDDEANQKLYAIGASQQQPVYLEGAITNNLLSEPQSLLDWAKEQMAIFNHPRFNYTVTPLHDQNVALGDIITVQDFHIKPMILVNSKVIQKTTSFANPDTNTFTLGEFSSIFTDNMNRANNVITLIKKDVTVVEQAAQDASNKAEIARQQADAAHDAAVQAASAAYNAQVSADGKAVILTVKSLDELPQTAKEGTQAWYDAANGTYLYVFLNGKWVKRIDPDMAANITNGVNKATSDAKAYTDQAIATNDTNVSASIKAVDDKANALKADQATFDNKAQGYANQALNDSKANTSAAVQQTAKNATDALEQAKADLTGNIAKEATDRQNAVNALDKAAQGYANQAVAKEVSDRQNAVSALDSKTTGAINSARSDAQSALNALQVGGRNLFTNSKTLPWAFGSNSNATVTVEDFDANTKMYHIKSDKGHGQSAGMYIWGFCTERGLPKGSNWSFSADIKGTGYINNFGAEGSTNVVTKGAIGTDWSRLSQSGVASNADHISLIMYFDTDKSAVDVYIKLPKLEIGNMPTAYTQAPEDIVQDYTNRDNQITQSFTQYQQTNDGKVTKAQSDATQALGLVATKVSQSDYDTKTGDLDTKYTNVQQTVDGQTTEIADIKQTATDQSAKINTISSDVDGTKQSISAIQTKDGQQDTRMGTIETSVSGVKSDFSTYKTSNDGAVKMAQTIAQTAVDGLKTKVSQTDYDKKTGQLQTDLTSTTQTATQAKNDIVSIKQKDGDQDSRMNSIESDAKGTKQTISDIQTTQGKQSGSISTLQQRADGFDATVTKVNNLQVGGRNLLLNTKQFITAGGVNYANGNFNSAGGVWTLSRGLNVAGLVKQYGSDKTITLSFDWFATGDNLSGTFNPQWNNTPWGGLVNSSVKVSSTNTSGHVVTSVSLGRNGYVNGTANAVMFRQDNLQGNITISNVKLEIGNTSTDWTPAPEDVYSATAKAQLTADQATTALSNYKTDADGRISKAQADITATAKQVQTKVSQTDYDQKTGDLSTKVSTAQQTADSANTTIGDYKKANDGRVSSAESGIKQNTDEISSKVSQTDYDQKTGKLDGQISSLNQTAKDITTSIGKISDRVDSFNAPNLFQNSEFETDTGYRNKNGTVTISGATKNNIDGKYNGTVIVTNSAGKGTYLGWWSNRIPVQGGQVYSASVLTHFNQSGSGLALLDIWFVDKDNQRISAAGFSTGNKANPYWVFLKSEGFIAPQNAVNMEVSLLVMNNGDGAQTATFTQPMVTATDKVKPYTPNITDKQFSTQQQKIDSISSIVSDPNTGLTKRVQTAEGFMTSATDRLGKVENKSTSTADGLTREIKDRTDGDNNTLQQGKDFTTSQISNSESGMKSFVNQTISGLQIGAISSDVNALKLSTQWQTVNVDDLNNMTNQGKFFIQGVNHTNAPVGGWLYLTVDKPINGRITQVAWADSNPTMQYTRILFGSNWSNWNRVVTNETVLSIFNDSWSLGTSANDGITQKLITGINGQADGTLVLSGKSVVLNSDTVIGNNFVIGSANIANAAIGTAQIGDAAITSAKIASIDARKITTGQLLGSNLNIDLDAGNVFFQKGRIYDSQTRVDINIDQAYVRTTNGGGSATLQNGRLLLTGPVYNNGQTIDSNPYFSVSASLLPTFANQPDGAVGSLLQSKDFSEISVSGHGSIGFLANMAAEKGAGIGISAVTGTYVAGNDQGVILSGGKDIGGVITAESPNFVVGYDDSKGVDGKDVGGNSILARANNFVVAANNFSVDKNGNGKVSNGFFARNIGTNGYHTIVSQDNGRVYFSGGNNNLIDISVKTVSQSSLVSLKENIRNIDPEYALAEVLKSDVKQYNFIGESKDNIRVSPMIDDVDHELYIPKDWLAEDGKSVENYTITGYLIQSIKALQQEIKELKQG